MNTKGILNMATNMKLLLGMLVFITIGVSVQKFYFGDINNLVIFKTSFYNLINHKDLYNGLNMFKGQHLDLFKYSPAFALLFAPLAALPLMADLILWNLLNVALFFFAVKSLPFNEQKKSVIIWLTLLELITSTQCNQSNTLMAALIIFAFTAMESKNILLATFCIVFSIYIKLFGAIAFILFLFYPNKLKTALYSIIWMVILFLLPIIVVAPAELMNVYKSWANMLHQDEFTSWGLSVMGIINIGFGTNISKTIIQVIGLGLLCIPLLRIKLYQNLQFKLLYLCSILLWVVIFNHKAESPSFIIALAGVAIWFVMLEPKPLTTYLVLFAIAFTSLAHSDLFPHSFKVDYILHYRLKCLPSFILWLVIQYSIYVMAFKPSTLLANTKAV